MKDKVVIITGASSGIGLATARYFGNRESWLILAARSEDKLKKIEQQFIRDGIRVLSVPTDVRKESDCKNLIDKTIEHYGRIDILINNAGVSMRALFGDLLLDVFHVVMDTNFWGTVYCTKFALPYLLETKGTVTGVSSVAGLQGLPGRTAYSASKFALHGFLEALRMEYRSYGLHVFIIAPGFTSSNIRVSALTADGKPQGLSPRVEKRMMTSDQVAKHIYNGIKKKRRMIVLTATGKAIFLLRKISPRLMDRVTLYFMAREPGSPFKG